MDFVKLISYLFHSRTQTHIFHLQTQSYAEHMALNTYYDGIVPLVDGLVEAYQGKYGIIKGYTSVELQEYQSCEAAIMYFTALSMFVERARTQISQDSYLQNQVDEIVALIASTLYKLKFLK